MKTLLTTLLLITSLFTQAQFLSLSKHDIESCLSNVYHVSGTSDGVNYISAPNVSGSLCLYIFDRNGICIKEIIISDNIEITNMIMSLDEVHYVKLNDISYHEEKYGIVTAKKEGDACRSEEH